MVSENVERDEGGVRCLPEQHPEYRKGMVDAYRNVLFRLDRCLNIDQVRCAVLRIQDEVERLRGEE